MKPTNPKAFPGDLVIVENTHRRNNQPEYAKVLKTNTLWVKPWLNNHVYTVRLERKTPTGQSIKLDIQEKQLKKVFIK